MNDKDKGSKFSSAMEDLKGLLDREGIGLNSDSIHGSDSDPIKDDDSPPTHLPTLDGTIIVEDHKESGAMDIDDYISDIENEQFDIMDFTRSVKDLEEKVESITEPEHLYQFEQQESDDAQIEKLKINLSNKLTKQIEKSVNDLKINLLESMKKEIDDFFKK